MSEVRSRRMFFALWPDDEATGHLSALAHSFAAEGGRAIRPVSLHLTLAFVGSVTPGQVEDLERIAAEEEIFVAGKAEHCIACAHAFIITSAHPYHRVGVADAWLWVPSGVERRVERQAIVVDFD